jgi:mRNA-degrading endonuclease HigB of HigAB toxin-antitoxin module
MIDFLSSKVNISCKKTKNISFLMFRIHKILINFYQEHR